MRSFHFGPFWANFTFEVRQQKCIFSLLNAINLKALLFNMLVEEFLLKKAKMYPHSGVSIRPWLRMPLGPRGGDWPNSIWYSIAKKVEELPQWHMCQNYKHGLQFSEIGLSLKGVHAQMRKWHFCMSPRFAGAHCTYWTKYSTGTVPVKFLHKTVTCSMLLFWLFFLFLLVKYFKGGSKRLYICPLLFFA